MTGANQRGLSAGAMRDQPRLARVRAPFEPSYGALILA
jgi:hypothetical protein